MKSSVENKGSTINHTAILPTMASLAQDGSELLLPSARPKTSTNVDCTPAATTSNITITPATITSSATTSGNINITSDSSKTVEEKEETGTFKFTPIEASAFPLQKEREHKDLSQKWGMDRCCEYRTFRFDERFTVLKLDAFCRDFFHDPAVQSTLRTATARGEMVRGGLQGTKTPANMSSCCKLLSTKQVRMDIFNKMKEDGLVNAETGRLRGCMPELFDGVEADTLVRDMLINEDSEHFYIYDDDDRNEFLFRIFQHLIVGGGMCQSDEYIEPYLNMTKHLYKSLVKVRKVARENGPKVEVTSNVISVQATKQQIPGLFPTDSNYHFCYLIVDASTRKVTVWYNAWVSFW